MSAGIDVGRIVERYESGTVQAHGVLRAEAQAVEFTGEVHPVAELFPMLPDDELGELAEDIRAHGLLQPLVLDAEGRLLDGRNRLAACKLANVVPTFDVYEGPDPDAYALSVNIARRHMTTGARAVVAARAIRLNGGSARETAERYNLYHSRVVEASAVLDHAPDLADAVVSGAMPLSKAVEEARDRKRAAAELAEKVERLRHESPDLAALVDEERMSVDDAIGALDARNEQERSEAQEQERRRAEERRDALALLTRIVDLAAPADADDAEDWAEAWAERLGDVPTNLVDRTEQAGRLLLALAERLRR